MMWSSGLVSCVGHEDVGVLMCFLLQRPAMSRPVNVIRGYLGFEIDCAPRPQICAARYCSNCLLRAF